ncbi:hypothetical protein [Nocardioides sp. R-C-SC26]|uniref:hypothetical protein n=1 Tax=Nocardioides sp. R-C-SC26 TaxID=2870414 RepID=UPI001E45530F|nr:hypothetical protein [Nocardioides sp. R-C-SC26]
MRRTPTTRRIGATSSLLAGLVAVIGMALLSGCSDETSGSGGDASSAVDLIDAEAAAEQAAQEAAVAMTTYDHRSVEKDFGWVFEDATESFQRNFAAASVDSKKVITTLQASATGTVVDSAATADDAEHVKVLLFLDQEVTTPDDDEPRIDQPRVTVQMVLEGGRWLVDDVVVNDLLS